MTPPPATFTPPSQTSTPPVAPADLITTTGIGLYQRGASYPDAAAALGGPADPDRCLWVLNARGDQFWTWVLAETDGTTAGDTIDLVAIDDFAMSFAPTTAPRTAAGVGLGSTESEVRAAYPSATEAEPHNVDTALRYTDGDGSIVFAIRQGLVQGVTVLAADAAEPWEYCA